MLFNTNLPKQLNKSQRIYLTADQHYGHRKIIQYSNRPFKDLDEMNKVLKENHNKVVRPNDHIIHIGDFLFGKAYDLIRLLRELNGHHYLIDGSHDQALEDVINEGGFPEDVKVTILPKLFEFKYGGHKIVLCHYAMAKWMASHHGSLHFYGHSHGNYNNGGRSMDVGVDCHNYSPILLEDAIERVHNKPIFETRKY